ASSSCRARPRATPSAATNSTPCWRWPNPAARSCSKPSAKRWRADAPRSRRSAQAMTLVIASGNAGKLAEIRRLLGDAGTDCVAQGELGVGDIEETGLSFVENALLKARHAAHATGLPALADDSGLCVDALGGAPGLYSARYAGTHGDARANIDKLLDALRDVPDERRGAHF